MLIAPALAALKASIDSVSDDALRKTLREDFARLRDAVTDAEPRGYRTSAVDGKGSWRDILLRAWQADPVRTETDLIRLGCHDLVSQIGAEYHAAYARGEIQLEMYQEGP